MTYMAERFWKAVNEILGRVSAEMQAYSYGAGFLTQQREIEAMKSSMTYLEGYIEAYEEAGVLSDWDYEDIDIVTEEAYSEFYSWADRNFYNSGRW